MYLSTPELFIINNITPVKEEELASGFYIVVTNVLAIPPHLGLLLNGQLFSLSVKGVTSKGNLPSFIRTLKTKNIQTIFIRLKLPEEFNAEELQNELVAQMLNYTRVDTSKNITCLTPVKSVCQAVFNLTLDNVNVIFDLLPELHAHNKIAAYYAFNLDNNICNKCISLRKYNLADVKNNINTLTDNVL